MIKCNKQYREGLWAKKREITVNKKGVKQEKRKKKNTVVKFSVEEIEAIFMTFYKFQ